LLIAINPHGEWVFHEAEGAIDDTLLNKRILDIQSFYPQLRYRNLGGGVLF